MGVPSSGVHAREDGGVAGKLSPFGISVSSASWFCKERTICVCVCLHARVHVCICVRVLGAFAGQYDPGGG